MTEDRQIARSGRAFVAHPPPVPTPRGTVEPPLPGPLTMAANYARSTVRHLAAGRPQASPELQAARLAACESCDHLRPSDRRCGLVRGCGCGCPVDEKVQRLLDRCPVNRWPEPGPEPGTESAGPRLPAAPH